MKITIYTISGCPFSKEEKEYLQSKSIAFEEKNLETNREFLTEMLAVSNNFAGTPVTKIDKDDGQVVVLKGFTQQELEDAVAPAMKMQQAADEPSQQMPAPNPPPSDQPKMPPSPPPAAPTPQPGPGPVPPVQGPTIPSPMPPAPPPVQEPPKEPVQPKMPPAPEPVQPKIATNDDALSAILKDLQTKASQQNQAVQTEGNIPNPPAPQQ